MNHLCLFINLNSNFERTLQYSDDFALAHIASQKSKELYELDL
jgi:hypothetical protein